MRPDYFTINTSTSITLYSAVLGLNFMLQVHLQMSNHSKKHVGAADGLGDIEAAKDKSLGHNSTGKVAQVI